MTQKLKRNRTWQIHKISGSV